MSISLSLWTRNYIACERTTKRTPPKIPLLLEWRHCRNGPQRKRRLLPLLRCMAMACKQGSYCWLLTYSVHVTIFIWWQHCDSESGLLGMHSSGCDQWYRSFMWSTPQFSVSISWHQWDISVTQHETFSWTFNEDLYQILWKPVALWLDSNAVQVEGGGSVGFLRPHVSIWYSTHSQRTICASLGMLQGDRKSWICCTLRLGA
jgi:hypothetical protein